MEIAMSLWNMSTLAAVVLAMLAVMGCSRSNGGQGKSESASSSSATATAEMTVTSPAFEDGKAIPKEFTADGADVSPELRVANVPPGAKELVVIVDDPDAPTPDAPKMTWDHWLLYKIPADQNVLPKGVSAARKKVHPKDMLEGKNSWGNVGYEGPEPPPTSKPHRYFFKVYALNAPLTAREGLDKKALLKAMEGKVIAQAQVIGMYGRGK